MERNVEDFNLFMMCKKLNCAALSELPLGYYFRYCKESELDFWKKMHFDDIEIAEKYFNFMTDYYNDNYAAKEDLFFKSCVFVCDRNDNPVASCFLWKAYESVTTVHWFKVIKKYEGQGIGRALLSYIMKGADPEDYPVFLHTQPGSYRAIKLYMDFGFTFISDDKVGYRENELKEAMPYLKENMAKEVFEAMKMEPAPKHFLKAALSDKRSRF